jgi:hypothetical protein
MMSSGGGRHSSFGGKGASQKKDRKKKQDYHKHKAKYVEESQFDFEQLKSRVTVSLQKLGQQVFSTEPGGYSFADWMKSLNFLLDDFEEKAGGANLPKEYFEKRLQLTSELLKPVDTSDVDNEIESIHTEEISLNDRLLEKKKESRRLIEQERNESNLKMDELRRQHRECLSKLEEERNILEERKKIRKNIGTSSSSSFFKKLFSKNDDPNSVEAISRRIVELENKNKELEENIRNLQDKRNATTKLGTSLRDIQEKQAVEEIDEKMDALKSRLAGLEATRAKRMQLEEKREQTTSTLSVVISKILLNNQS